MMQKYPGRRGLSALLLATAFCAAVGCAGKRPASEAESRSGSATAAQSAATADDFTNPGGENMEITQTLPTPPSFEPLFTEAGEVNAPTGAALPAPAALKGKADAAAKTFTGLAPLPARAIAIPDPNNSGNLPVKKIEHSYGVAKNAMPHSISVQNQRFFESKRYAAAAYDTSGKKVIYLTFDCGYENGNTDIVLDVLKAKKVPAAFFCTLDEMKTAPKTVARMIREGHIVGNHSAKHPSFAEIDRSRMAREILETDNYLRENFGYSAPYFRFPKGEYNESALEAVASLGFVSVFWSAAYSDWDVSVQKGGDYAAETVLARLHPGAILLLHSVSADNAAGMAKIVDGARVAGYEFQALPSLPLFTP
ncbi:MAG: polysaccharide deacetylase family protein [Oscillospiraceae bacterium]|jgi:peptidoglycan-N-acetylmuramic acid deacetylase|nr:polysaccharide deacetylase family protein [Oscillospiraceae bacterium]